MFFFFMQPVTFPDKLAVSHTKIHDLSNLYGSSSTCLTKRKTSEKSPDRTSGVGLLLRPFNLPTPSSSLGVVEVKWAFLELKLLLLVGRWGFRFSGFQGTSMLLLACIVVNFCMQTFTFCLGICLSRKFFVSMICDVNVVCLFLLSELFIIIIVCI